MASAALLQHDAFAPRRPPGMRAGLVLAVIAHLLLIAALAWSVRWHASEPEGVVAELWSAVPQIAAPRAAAQEPPPPPRVEPAPPRPAPRVVVAPPPDTRADAQIATERAAAEKARRADEQRQEAARQAELARRQSKKEEAQRAEAERRRQAQEKQLQDKQAEEKARERSKELARQDESRLAAIREANLKRMRAQAGASDEAAPSTDTGTAGRSAGPSATYAGRIKARIKPNIVLTASVSGNPLATVEVRCAPDGTIIGKKLVRSSGSPAWDEAVLRAIDKTEVLPRDTDGRVPASFSIDFKPSE